MKASILWHTGSFMIQLSHPSVLDYWKNHSLTIQAFFGKVMLLKMLSTFVIAFLPRGRLFFFLNFEAAVTLVSDF